MTETPDPFAPPPAQPPQPPAGGYPPPGNPAPDPGGYPPPGYQPPPPGYQAAPPGYQTPPPGYQVPPPGYAQPYGAPAGWAPQGATLPTGLAIAALVLGIIACLGFWIPFGGAILGLIALVLGIVAWRRASAGRAGGKPMAIIGTILGGLAVVGGIIATVLLIWVFGRVAHCTDANLTDQEISNCVNDELGVN